MKTRTYYWLAAAALVVLLIIGTCYVTDTGNLFGWVFGADPETVLGE